MKLTKKIAVLLAFAVTVNEAAFINPTSASAAKKVALSTKKLTVKVGQSKNLKLKNNKKKVKWTVISGKKNITLKGKKKTGVTVVGRKKGSAKVQAKVGKKKYTCTVTVKAKKATKATKTPTPAVTPSPAPTFIFDEKEWKDKAPGLYDSETKKLKKSWDTLIKEDVFSVSEYNRLMPGAKTKEFYDSESYYQGLLNQELSGVLVIQDGLTCIGGKAEGGYMALSQSNLTGIVIPNSVKSIGYHAFSGCANLAGVAIPDSVTVIDFNAFASCTSLADVTIPDSVTFIGLGAFYGCPMTSITIPGSVTFIDEHAFGNCRNLKKVTFEGKQADIAIAPDAFSDTPWGAAHPISAPVVPGDHESDVAALKKIIAEQRARGASVSEDISDSSQYTWNEEGRLTEINWFGMNISGSISFSELPNLLIIFCNQGGTINIGAENYYLTSLDVSGCLLLRTLLCSGHCITTLDLSNNIYLQTLTCKNIFNKCVLDELDLRNNKKLDSLEMKVRTEGLFLPDNKILEDFR